MTSRLLDTLVAYLIAAWLGATLLFGVVVAPAAFAVLPSRSLAGLLVGQVLPVLFYTGMLVGILVLAHGIGIASPRRRLVRLTGGVVILASCAVAQFVIGSRMERARASAAVPLEELEEGDPIRVTFGRLHGLSVASLGLAVLGAAGVLVLFGTGSGEGAMARRSEKGEPRITARR